MSKRPIQVGDLVMIVRSTMCCNNPSTLGMVFQVTGFVTKVRECRNCGAKFSAVSATNSMDKSTVRIERLKRIDPGCIDETQDDKEELRV